MSIIERVLNFSFVRKPLFIFSQLLQIAKLKKNFYLSSSALNEYFDSLTSNQPSVSLDLGSGPRPKNPFRSNSVFGADLRANAENNVFYSDLSSGKLPFEDATFDYVTAYDVLEHIERVSSSNGEQSFPFVKLMNEVFRVLKPGGIIFSIQPCYPARQAFQDPTHVNIMTEDTLNLYFCEKAWARIYGYDGSFMMLFDGWLGDKYFSFMKKSAKEPVRKLDYVQK